MDLDPALIDEMRAMAQRGVHTSEILHLAAHSREQGGRIVAISHFRAAFGLTLGQCMPLGAWSGFALGEACSDESIDQEFDPLLRGSPP